jgi:hypothetical protein
MICCYTVIFYINRESEESEKSQVWLKRIPEHSMSMMELKILNPKDMLGLVFLSLARIQTKPSHNFLKHNNDNKHVAHDIGLWLCSNK